MTKPREINIRSVSQYSQYTGCSEKYRIRKVERIEEPPAAWLAQGTAFHAAIETWERSGRSIDAGAVYLTTYDQLIAEGKEREPNLSKWLRAPRQLTLNDIARRRERGLDQVLAYIENARTAPWRVWELPNGEPALEVAFRLDLGEVIVIGFVDKVLEWNNGAVTPRDYKTGAKIPSSELQLGVYALALRESFGLDTWFGDWWLSRHGGATDPTPLYRYTREYITEIMTGLDRGITSEIFLPNPGDHCKLCGVKPHCRELGLTVSAPTVTPNTYV